MYIAPTIKTEKIERAGVLSCVRLEGFEPGIKKKIEKTKICIDKETKEMYFEKQGDSIVVITDKLGVREGLLGTLFLNKDCVFVDFHAGEVFIEEEGKVYSIQETGKVSEVADSEGIKWVTVKDIQGVVEPTVRAKYNQECRKVIKHYMENLMYTVEMRNTYIPETKEIPSSYMYQVKVYGLATDISLGCVEFARVEKENKADIDMEKIKEEQEQIEKEEKEEAARVEQEARQLKEQERELEARYKMIKEGGDYEGDVDTEEITSEELEGMLMEL